MTKLSIVLSICAISLSFVALCVTWFDERAIDVCERAVMGGTP